MEKKKKSDVLVSEDIYLDRLRKHMEDSIKEKIPFWEIEIKSRESTLDALHQRIKLAEEAKKESFARFNLEIKNLNKSIATMEKEIDKLKSKQKELIKTNKANKKPSQKSQKIKTLPQKK